METLVAWFRDTLLPYGGWGILALASLDGSFVPMPQLIDVAVMLAAGFHPQLAWAYALAAVVGSTVGTMCIYGLARAGRTGDGGKRLRWAEARLRRHGVWGVFVATLLPPPFPFKVVVVAAGVLRQPPWGFVAAVAAGRLIRFGSEAAIAAVYGRRIVETVQDRAPLAGLILALVAAAGITLYFVWRRGAEAEIE